MKLGKGSVTARPIVILMTLCSVAVAPAHLRAQRPAFGIGAIIDTVDYTTDSFNFFRYFKSHPVAVNGDTLRPILVDRAVDAHFAITGIVETKIEAGKHEDDDRRFSFFHDANIRVWHDGKKLGDVFALCSGNARKTGKGPDPALDDLRYSTMSDCFEKLRADIGSMLTQRAAQGGAQ